MMTTSLPIPPSTNWFDAIVVSYLPMSYELWLTLCLLFFLLLWHYTMHNCHSQVCFSFTFSCCRWKNYNHTVFVDSRFRYIRNIYVRFEIHDKRVIHGDRSRLDSRAGACSKRQVVCFQESDGISKSVSFTIKFQILDFYFTLLSNLEHRFFYKLHWLRSWAWILNRDGSWSFKSCCSPSWTQRHNERHSCTVKWCIEQVLVSKP